jgi:hypothetical protein
MRSRQWNWFESTLLGRDRLKRSNLLFDFLALALRTPEFFLFILGKGKYQAERLLAFLTQKFVRGHGRPPSL